MATGDGPPQNPPLSREEGIRKYDRRSRGGQAGAEEAAKLELHRGLRIPRELSILFPAVGVLRCLSSVSTSTRLIHPSASEPASLLTHALSPVLRSEAWPRGKKRIGGVDWRGELNHRHG